VERCESEWQKSIPPFSISPQNADIVENDSRVNENPFPPFRLFVLEEIRRLVHLH